MDKVSNILFAVAVAAMMLSFVCGLMFLLFPAGFRKVAWQLDQWFSPSPLLEALDKPRYLERRFYRHHKRVGGVVVLGATYTLVRLTGLHGHAAAELLPPVWGIEPRRDLIQLGVMILAISNAMALAAGIIVYFRPSLLKRGETVANRWWSTAPALEPLDTPHGEVNNWFWSHPRLAGLGMMVAATYILGIISAFYFRLW